MIGVLRAFCGQGQTTCSIDQYSQPDETKTQNRLQCDFLISQTLQPTVSTLGFSLWHDITSVPGCLFKEAVENQHVRQYRKQQPWQWESETFTSQTPWFLLDIVARLVVSTFLGKMTPFFDGFFLVQKWGCQGPAATSVPILGFQRSLAKISVNGWKDVVM